MEHLMHVASCCSCLKVYTNDTYRHSPTANFVQTLSPNASQKILWNFQWSIWMNVKWINSNSNSHRCSSFWLSKTKKKIWLHSDVSIVRACTSFKFRYKFNDTLNVATIIECEMILYISQIFRLHDTTIVSAFTLANRMQIDDKNKILLEEEYKKECETIPLFAFSGEVNSEHNKQWRCIFEMENRREYHIFD